MTRILAISDEIDAVLYHEAAASLGADIVVACGDLPADYLEYIETKTNVPLVYVPGNHDPELKCRPMDDEMLSLGRALSGRKPKSISERRPLGCINVDGRIVDAAGLRIIGLGGSHRYSPGPNQYTQTQMWLRVLKVELRGRLRRLRDGRGIDVLVTHSPPLMMGDQEDRAHRGFASFHRLVSVFAPKLLIHGHIHAHGQTRPDRLMRDTRVVNAVGHRIVEVDE